MQCLYCGRQLALLRKLTGGGKFCSDAHRESYQEEYNRLALSRLLQSQTPGEPEPPAPAPAQKPKTRAGNTPAVEDAGADQQLPPPPPPPRTGSILGIEAPALPPPAQTVARALSAPTDATSRDAKRRAGFVPSNLPGFTGVVSARSDVRPDLAIETPEIGSSKAGLPTAATLPSSLGFVRAKLAGTRSSATAFGMHEPVCVLSDPQPALPEPAPVRASTRAPAEARWLTGTIRGRVSERMDVLWTGCDPVPSDWEAQAPAARPYGGASRVPQGAPRSHPALAAAVPQKTALSATDPAGFELVWSFEDTLMPGFVAGFRLGEEQIRFERGAAGDADERHGEEANIIDGEERMLPSEFIAAVGEQARETGAPVEEPAEGIAVSAGPEAAATEEAAAAGEHICAWLPIALTPALVTTRQRLMQAFQAIGLAPATPAPPDFCMMPLRPKFLPQPATIDGSGESDVAVSATAVAEREHELPLDGQPASAGEERAESEAAGKEAPVAQPTLDFLESYEQKRSGFSKLLGKIGMGCLLVAALPGAGPVISAACRAASCCRHCGLL